MRIDGTLFARPIYVGDPGAKNAQADDKVVIEMVRFPSPLHDGEGVITEVLGPRGTPGVDTLSIIREFNLPDRFPSDASDEAYRQTEHVRRIDRRPHRLHRRDDRDDRPGRRAGFRRRHFARAIGQWPLAAGGPHCRRVALRPARRRPWTARPWSAATSVYLPDRVLPMLPETISNGLASLQPGKVRYTKSAVMEFTDDGLRVSTELFSAAIRSSKRLTYEQVDEFPASPAIRTVGRACATASQKQCERRESGTACKQAVAHDPAVRKKLGGKVCDLLGRMHALAMTLRRRRMAKGSLELNMPEVKVELDKQGRVTGAHVVENTESHQIIEEFMLAANEAVAETLRDRGLHFLRRVHQSPSPQKLQALTGVRGRVGLQDGKPAKPL